MEPKDEIAIVGIGCHFPGGEGIDNFWKVLIEGRNCTVDIPPERFNVKKWYDSDTNKPGKIFTKHASLLDEFNRFDNKLFGINDMEADRMDPQQKLLLECTYKALEDAGIPTEEISGTKTGVFVGMMNHDHKVLLSQSVEEITHYDGTGVAVSIAANRISYTFNLTGPSVALDTACSSFLYALHYALHAIRQGDCETALCGGVNCIIDPHMFVSLCKAKMISPDGMSKPFSKKADGYGRGEGCGVLLLKPLKKAQEDFNKIWGIICTSAVNQVGRYVTPITKPSQQQQENLLCGIYPALIDPSTVQYVEAHGTGTPVGDPVEAESIGNAIGKKRPPNLPPLKVGSVKGNIGHTESAAGAAGIIKVLLMMQHGKIVPSLHYSKSNSSIDTEKLNLSIPTTVEKWDESHEFGRVAGINCFGFGGTNAHVVVRQAKQTPHLPSVHRPVELFVISAASGNSLKLSMEDTARYLNTGGSATLPNLAYTSACRRSHLNHKYRKAFVVSSLQHLEQQLLSAAETETVPSKKPMQLIFVFPGNGLKLKGIFRALLKSEPVFRDKCKEIEQLFQKYSSNGILELSEREDVDLSNPEIAQPLLFTLQVALVTLLQYWGIKPIAAVGHSVGEAAAAHCAGLLSLEDAVKVVHHRSRLQAKVAGGKMLVVGNIPVEEVSAALSAYSGKVCVAALNSPQSCTLSGDEESIRAAQKHLAENFNKRNIFLYLLNVPVAYHSHMMEPVLQEITESLPVLEKQKPKVEVFSTLTGKAASEDDFVTGTYWARQVREPVSFAEAIQTSVKGKENAMFVEIGPQRALQRYINEILGTQVKVFSSMQVDKEYEALFTLMKGLFELGFNLDWQHLYERYQGAPADYPRYCFDHKRTGRTIEFIQQQKQEAASLNHPLIPKGNHGNTEFKNCISQSATAYLYEHKHKGIVLVPGAYFAQLALAAVMEVSKTKVPLTLWQLNIKFTSPCVLSKDSHDLDVKMELQEEAAAFKILSPSGAIHASGQVTKNTELPLEETSISYKDIFLRCKSVISRDELYEILSASGFQYGPVFRQLSDVFYCEELKEAITTMNVKKQTTEEMHRFVIHPVLLDCFLQMTVVMITTSAFKNTVGFPSGIGSLVIVRPLEEEMLLYMKISKVADNYLEFCGCFTDKHGSVLVEMKHVQITFVKETPMRENGLLFQSKWKEINLSQNSREAPIVAVFADKIGVSQQLKKCLHKNSRFLMYEDWEKLLESRSPESAAQDKVKLEVMDYSDVLFMWGIQRLNEENSDVVASLAKCCEAFRQLVITLKERNSRCAITIITYRTTDRSVDHINPGFALYGMVRACMLEATNITFQMIDISSTSTMDILALADVLVGYDAQIYPEVWINQGRIYTSEVRQTQTDSVCSNVTSQISQVSELFAVYTSEPYEVQDLFAELVDDINTPLDNYSVEVQIEKISIHSEDYFSVSLSSWNFGNTLYWNSQTIGKYRLLALDCSGTVIATGCKVKKFSVGDHIASCFPVVAASRLKLPESVCLNTQKFPCFEKVPYVSFFRIAWEILHQILPKMKQNECLGIISTQPESVLCKVLAHSAHEGGCKTKIAILDESLEECIAHCSSLVFLPPLERIPKDVLARLSHLQHVVVILGNRNSEFLSSLLGSGPEHFQIHVLNLATIFQKASLKQTHKLFSRWMKSMQLKQFKNVPCLPFQQRQNDAMSSYFTCKSVPFVALKGGKHDSCISDIPVYKAKKLFQQNAVYMVTGGLTGLGFETVKFIAQNGGGCIVILSRRQPNAEMQKEICNVQNQNKQSMIVSVQCNVISKSDVENAIKLISKTFPKYPIKGVFHSAVVFHDASIEALSRATFEEVLSAKVAGALNLHHATQGLNLDYFVCYSSVSSFLGNAMQANYAAANSFLEHFCHYRRNCGLPGQSISWGALNLGVLQNQSSIQNLLESKGIAILQVNEIHEYLKTSLILNNPQQVVVKLNFKSLITHYFSRNPAVRSRMRPLLEEVAGHVLELPENNVSNDLDPIKAEDYVMSLVSELSGADSSDIATNKPLVSLGIDSMLAMTIQNRIFQERNIDVPLVKLLDPETSVLSLASLLEESFEERPPKRKSLKKHPQKEHKERQNIGGDKWSTYL